MAQQPSILTCECGSTFFFTVRAEQFQAGGFGTAEFRSISNAPKTLLVCICGHPYTPKPGYHARGTVAAAAEEAFRKSVEAAQKHLKEHSLDNIAQIAANPAEVEKLGSRIKSLADELEAVRTSISKLTTPDKKKKKEEADGKPAQASSS